MVKEILDGVITGVTGAGDVDGPSSSTDNAVARYDGATGKTIQNSSVLINDAGDLTVTGDIYTNGVLVPAEGAEYTSRTVNVDSTMTTAEIQAAIDGIGKYLHDGVVITVQFADGTYTMTDTLYVKGFRGGGEIYLYGNAADASLSTTKSVKLEWTTEAYGIDVVNCDNAFVERMELSRDDTSFVGTGRIVRFYNGGRGTLRNCYLKSTGKVGTQFAVNVAVMQGFVLTNIYFENSDYGLYTTNSQVFVSGCASVVGSEPTYGIGSTQASIVGITPGGEPDGSTSKYRTSLGGTIVYDGVVLGSTLYVDNDNERVGILQDSPQGKLHVGEGSGVSSFPTSNDEFIMEHSSSGGIGIFTPDANYGSVLFGSPSDTAAGVVRWSYDNNHLQIGTQTTGAETQLMSSNGAVGLTLDSDGNIGIGTTSPSELLVVGDDLGNMGSGNGLVIGDDTNKPALYIGVDGNNRSSQAWNQFNNYWSISNWVGGTAYTDVLTIKADKVGINDTTPSYELDVTGDAQVTGTLYGAARIYAHYTKTVSATQDIGGVAGTTTAISWDSEINEDTGFTHDNATNNSRVTVTNAGRYEIKATVSAKNSGAGRFGGEIYFKINGTTDVKRGIGRAYSRGSAYNDDISLHLSTEYDLSASDYIEIITNVDDTDATYTVNTNDVECELILRKLD